MTVKKLKMLYFSPTGTTGKIVEAIAGSIKCEIKEIVDFTKKSVREKSDADFSGDLVIIGAPVYYGRIPAVVSDFFSKIHVQGVHAVLVVVYGNREYEDSLKELYDRACAAGFIPIAGAAFIGEHSYSSEKLPMAQGRPDETDLEKVKEFGAAVQKDIDFLTGRDSSITLSVPGSADYENRSKPDYPVAPETKKDQCSLCRKCIEGCPEEAIALDEHSALITDIKACILCFACVKNCPEQARGIDDILWSGAMEMLQKRCMVRKEPEYFFKGRL